MLRLHSHTSSSARDRGVTFPFLSLRISSKLPRQSSSSAPSATPPGEVWRCGGGASAGHGFRRLSRAGWSRRCNYYVSSGAYSPGVFNLVLFVSQPDPHFFGEEREATPGLKLINQAGFTFRRPCARRLLRCRLPPRSRSAPVAEPISGAECLGEPSERTGNHSEYAVTSPDAFNSLSPELSPSPGFPHPQVSWGAYIFAGWSS